MILDGNYCDIGLESTILKCDDKKIHILREGYITREKIKNVVCYERNKKKIYNFKNSDRNSDYKKQHLAILKNKFTDKLCTFKEGKQLVYLINQIKSKSKK